MKFPKVYISDLLLVFCVILLIYSLRNEARLRERLDLHSVLLTGPTACRLMMVVPAPNTDEISYFMTCKKGD